MLVVRYGLNVNPSSDMAGSMMLSTFLRTLEYGIAVSIKRIFMK